MRYTDVRNKLKQYTRFRGNHGPAVPGITMMASSGAMSLPRGDTKHGGGRGMFVGGSGTPTFLTQISYIEISSTG